MPKITAKIATKLKAKPLSSDKLKPEELADIPAGQALWVTKITPLNEHSEVELIFRGWKKAYVYNEHWVELGGREQRSLISDIAKQEKQKPKSKRLKLPYFAEQNDNQPWYSDGAAGNTQCNATSHTSLLAYLLPDFVSNSKTNGFDEPESYFKSKLEQYGCGRGDHDCFTNVLSDCFDIDSQWFTDLDRSDLIESIECNTPMVLGMEYSTAGHIVLAKGFDEGGVWIADCYGQRDGGNNWYSLISPGWGKKYGENEYYSWSLMDRIWFCGTGGYGRKVYSVRGNLTGIRQ